jgi:hypothetical protein
MLVVGPSSGGTWHEARGSEADGGVSQALPSSQLGCQLDQDGVAKSGSWRSKQGRRPRTEQLVVVLCGPGTGRGCGGAKPSECRHP